jgi:hypothetical protein
LASCRNVKVKRSKQCCGSISHCIFILLSRVRGQQSCTSPRQTGDRDKHSQGPMRRPRQAQSRTDAEAETSTVKDRCGGCRRTGVNAHKIGFAVQDVSFHAALSTQYASIQASIMLRQGCDLFPVPRPCLGGWSHTPWELRHEASISQQAFHGNWICITVVSGNECITHCVCL